MPEHWIPFPTRPKAAFQLSLLHSLIALIILCNSRCFLCPHFYRRAPNAMVRLWLWNLGTAHVGSIKSRVFLYRAHSRPPQIPHVRFQKARQGDERRRRNQRERGGYEVFLRTFTATPRINTLFSCGAQPARVIRANH